MARPYWSGQITISLVSFGVKLYVATEAKSQIQFHQIDRASGERVRYQKLVASAVENPPTEDEPAPAPVQQSQIVKGYEYAKGQYVTIEPEELAHLRVPSKHAMEILQFVDEAQISPAYFEKPYFVTPESDAQTEAFATVRQALIDTKKVALTKIAFGGREHIVCIAPAGKGANGGMMAYTMRYSAELRDAADYFRDIKQVQVESDSLDLAKELIKRKTAAFDAAKFVDGYEVAVKELVDAKLNHLPIPQDAEPAPVRGKVVSLMDALRRSIHTGASAEAEPEEAPAEPARRTAHAPAKRAESKRAGLSLVKGSEKKPPTKAAAKRESKPATKVASSKRKSA